MEKKPFYIFKRKLNSGKSVYYWYKYNPDGTRSTPESTGKTKKNDAFNFCLSKFALQGLYQDKGITFEQFAAGWFTKDHYYLKHKREAGRIKDSTVNQRIKMLNTKILPYFKKYIIKNISTDDIYDFRKNLITEGLSGNYINSIIQTLRIMLKCAVEKNIITKNPMPDTLGEMKQEIRREAFTLPELKYLFQKEWSNPTVKLFCLVGVITGMRLSEVRGLCLDQIEDGYINIDRQYYGEVGLQKTKTEEKRFVTIPAKLKSLLIKNRRSDNFIFASLKNYNTPITERPIRQFLYENYSEEMLRDKDKRKLTYHSFRYFLNTYLLNNNIQQRKVDFIIGHSNKDCKMTELYTSWKPDMYNDVLKLQEKLIEDLLGPYVQE